MNVEEIKNDPRLKELTAEDWKVFLDFYDNRQREAAEGRDDDATELEIARDLYRAAGSDGLVPEPDGGVSRLRPGGMDWTDPETLRATRAATGQDNGWRVSVGAGGQKGDVKDMLQGVVVLVAGIGVAIWWFFWPTAGPATEVETHTERTAIVAEAGATPTPLPTLEADLLADIVESTGVKTGLVVPRTLEIKGVSFVVQPVKVSTGDWPLPDDERAVSWIFGTVVNYVLGLEATENNKNLLASLEPGDELLLRMSTGPAYRFTYLDLVRVAPQASEVFRQTRPGLTLTLLGEEEQATRIVMRAAYVPDSELGPALARVAAQAELGEPVMLDTLRLMVQSHRPLVRPETPPGHIYLAVTYQVRNMSQNLPLMTGSFVHHIEAGGLNFPLAPTTSQAMPPSLQPGEVLTVTTTYVIPETALTEAMTWSFAASPSSPPARITLPPYDGRMAVDVSVSEAKLQNERLTLKFHIKSALRAINISASDIMVEGGRLDLINYFPWQLSPGSEDEFSLMLFPETNPLRVGLLDQGFEVSY